jgi:hypothetical protein
LRVRVGLELPLSPQPLMLLPLNIN